MGNRLSYREFKDEFLLNFAIAVGAETGKSVNPEDVARRIKEKFQPSWTRAAVKELAEIGYVSGKMFINGGGDYSLTGRGLDRAEEIADESAADLYELIAEEDAVLSDESGNALVDEAGNRLVLEFNQPDSEAAPVVIKIDRLSEAFKELDKELQARIQELRGNNELMSERGGEARQHLAELEAGKVLINAEQADAGLVRRLLLPSLTWFAKKVRDEAASAMIKKLIALVLSFLGSA